MGLGRTSAQQQGQLLKVSSTTGQLVWHTTSCTCTTTTASTSTVGFEEFSFEKVPLRYYSVKELFEIKDPELRKYILHKGLVRCEDRIYASDDKKKKGYFFHEVSIKRDCRGGVFPRSVCKGYVVYYKDTKKVRLVDHPSVRKAFLWDYFGSMGNIVERIIGNRLTATFCKRIIEGKIKSIDDILSYLRSYRIRSKKISLDAILKFSIYLRYNSIGMFECPDEVDFSDGSAAGVIATLSDLPIKIKANESRESIMKRYEEWEYEQGKKYAELLGRGDGETCLRDVGQFGREGEGVCNSLSDEF